MSRHLLWKVLPGIFGDWLQSGRDENPTGIGQNLKETRHYLRPLFGWHGAAIQGHVLCDSTFQDGELGQGWDVMVTSWRHNENGARISKSGIGKSISQALDETAKEMSKYAEGR